MSIHCIYFPPLHRQEFTDYRCWPRFWAVVFWGSAAKRTKQLSVLEGAAPSAPRRDTVRPSRARAGVSALGADGAAPSNAVGGVHARVANPNKIRVRSGITV